MKIKESSSVSTVSLCKIPIGCCFRFEEHYHIKTDWSVSDHYKCVDLYNGALTQISANSEVYPVGATIFINKVGAIDDTSEFSDIMI